MSEKNAWQQWKENLGTTRPWDLLKKETEYVSEEIQEKRIEICKSCPKFSKITNQCKLCGCIMGLKVKLSAASCPLGKWE